MDNWLQKVKRYLQWRASDQGFLEGTKRFESLVSKLLSIAMLVVISVTMIDLVRYLARALLAPVPTAEYFFATTLSEIFGLFLSVLIALEILENITAYLKKHAVQVELVIVTSLTAVARKIIILDLASVKGVTLIGLAIAILALALSYWIVRSIHQE